MTATAVTPSRWSAALELPAGGPVDVDVVVHRRGLDDVRSTVHWVVGPSASDPAPVVSRAPVSGLLASASAALAVAAVFGAAWLLWRRRRRPAPAPGRTRAVAEHGAARPAASAAGPAASAVPGSTDAAQDETGAVAPRSAASR